MPAEIRVCGPRDGMHKGQINTCSSAKGSWSRGLSPFLLGPVTLYDGLMSVNVENAWQYSKVYHQHLGKDGMPSTAWWKWAKEGWNNPRAVRYPMGKGAVPAYSYWDGWCMNYVLARKCIYCPLYSQAVKGTMAFRYLRRECNLYKTIWLWDYDGYDHKAEGLDYQDVIDNPNRKMGHAFVLAMLLENRILWRER